MIVTTADRRTSPLLREFLDLIEWMVETGNYSAAEAADACTKAGVEPDVYHRVIVDALNNADLDAIADAARRVA